jgi:catechol-2,3-dioxygenase
VAFAVERDDLDRAQKHLRQLGVDSRFEDHGSTHSVYVADPDGNVVELTSYLA